MSDVLDITAGGKTYKLGRIGFDIRLDAEEGVRAARRAELKSVFEAIAVLPPESQRDAIITALDAFQRNVIVTLREVGEWIDSPTGELHQIWKSLKAQNPEATLDEARELVAHATADDYGKFGPFLAAGMVKG